MGFKNQIDKYFFSDYNNFIKWYNNDKQIVQKSKRTVVMRQDIERMFKEHGGIMRTSELKRAGFYYKKIQALLKNGQIEQVRRGYYQFVSNDSFSDIPTLIALFPDGVICMESALDYYGYTDRTPSGWHLAVKNTSSRSRFHIPYPPVRPHFIREDRYSTGISVGVIDGREVKIYDRERTICDILLHRNKIDGEVFNTAIQRYIQDPEKQKARLVEYAKGLHVQKKVREVLGVWL